MSFGLLQLQQAVIFSTNVTALVVVFQLFHKHASLAANIPNEIVRFHMVAVLCVTPIYLKSSYEFQMQSNKENATVKKLVDQWKQLYILIHKRQDVERLESSACHAMANDLSEFNGITLNNRMGAAVMDKLN